VKGEKKGCHAEVLEARVPARRHGVQAFTPPFGDAQCDTLFSILMVEYNLLMQLIPHIS
jgi:hypothetical protein